VHRAAVPPAWVDYNGHMTEWAYLLVMGDGSDAFFRYFGIDEAYRASGRSLYTVETHIRNLREAAAGEQLDLTLRVLGVDAKRVHIAHEVLHSDGELLATGEQMLLHVDTAAARTSPLPDVLHERLQQIAAAHAALPVPDWVGRVMRIPKEAGAWTSS
jgi:acyl-CoA thioesterase FadM